MPGERLLVVDDDDNLRSMLGAALRHHGFDVTLVANGRDAVTTGSEPGHDLNVLDVMLPDLDGFEVCRRLRADNVRTPIVFLTAPDTTDDRCSNAVTAQRRCRSIAFCSGRRPE